MIAVTGAAGFIGSCLISHLNTAGHVAILAVDEFSSKRKVKNLGSKQIAGLVHRDDFPKWLEKFPDKLSGIFHLGARTDTTSKDVEVFKKLNLDYSKQIWTFCSNNKVPFIYASSAATYGNGALGYNDDHDIVYQLKPLNLYGKSKNDFDKWVLQQAKHPPRWIGMKFFNVYGPNEYHKGRMASVIWHAWKQIQGGGQVKLFRSHRNDIPDGHQKRDFVYIKDVVRICRHFYEKEVINGLYNVGTGHARSFLELVLQIFLITGKNPKIDFIDTPQDIRNNYQYFTEANIEKLRASGYHESFYSLEEGVSDYLSSYLLHSAYI